MRKDNWVELFNFITYNTIMDHLKELIKESIELQKSESDCSDQSEEEIFDCVMENVVSMVEHYSFSDYNK